MVWYFMGGELLLVGISVTEVGPRREGFVSEFDQILGRVGSAEEQLFVYPQLL